MDGGMSEDETRFCGKGGSTKCFVSLAAAFYIRLGSKHILNQQLSVRTSHPADSLDLLSKYTPNGVQGATTGPSNTIRAFYVHEGLAGGVRAGPISA